MASPRPSSVDFDELPSSRLCYLDFHFRFNIQIGSQRVTRSQRLKSADLEKSPPPYSKSGESKAVVRQGPVRVTQRGRSWSCNIRWLVLTNTHLYLHGSANQTPRVVIPLVEITQFEREEYGSHCLILGTKSKAYLLTLRNDDDLYGWKDDISYLIAGVSNPYGFVHKVHVGWDSISQNYTVGFYSFIAFICENLSTTRKGSIPYDWKNILPKPFASEKPDLGLPQPVSIEDFEGEERAYPSSNSLRPMSTALSPSQLSHRVGLRIELDTSTRGNSSIGLSVLPNTSMRDILYHICLKANLETTNCGFALADADGDLTPLDMNISVASWERKNDLMLLTPEGRFPVRWD
ncbi:Non-specific serine/threonine protein kinase [Favolaschia claudopus]|uniref:Non-specific serine/threonine protein kinase n=1 Tax=Favolaschia claudopus TaxID=2862362 RepID=A0AAW0AX36_9AGAR